MVCKYHNNWFTSVEVEIKKLFKYPNVFQRPVKEISWTVQNLHNKESTKDTSEEIPLCSNAIRSGLIKLKGTVLYLENLQVSFYFTKNCPYSVLLRFFFVCFCFFIYSFPLFFSSSSSSSSSSPSFYN